jgi:TRAP-type C4-dicarboxylate transport system permease small subunit
MKKLTAGAAYRFLLLLVCSFTQAVVWAQDSTAASSSTVTTSTTETTAFVMQPSMWIAGAVVLLIILISIFKSGSNKEVAVTKTTVIRETDTQI